jgi:WD40 repeat protein
VAVTTLYAARGDAKSEERIVLFDAASGKMLKSVLHPAVVNCIAAAPDGRGIAEAGVDKMIRIRDAATLEITREFRAHDDSITMLAFHPNRRILASASVDLTIKLWDLESGKCLEVVRGVLKPPTQLRFGPGGRRLLTASGGVIHVWEPAALQGSR